VDIHIDWQGPLSLSEAIALKSDEDYGLYQYYGDHPVYGHNVLLYIGKASNQTLGNRISQHNWHSWIPAPIEIFVGRICTESPLDDREWERLIDLSERIQIFAHSPAFNTANLNKIGHEGDDVRILNWGKRKSLFPEVSVSRWESDCTLGHELPKSLIPCTCKK
jgi:hypothetical protein